MRGFDHKWLTFPFLLFVCHVFVSMSHEKRELSHDGAVCMSCVVCMSRSGCLAASREGSGTTCRVDTRKHDHGYNQHSPGPSPNQPGQSDGRVIMNGLIEDQSIISANMANARVRGRAVRGHRVRAWVDKGMDEG